MSEGVREGKGGGREERTYNICTYNIMHKYIYTLTLS